MDTKIPKNTSDKIYVFGDGDKIRDQVERLLFLNDLDDLKIISRRLIEAIDEIQSIAVNTMGAEVIIAGGDDFLFLMEKSNYKKELISNLALIFEQMTGCTISFGIGLSIEDAYLNLRKAKVMKTTKIMEPKE